VILRILISLAKLSIVAFAMLIVCIVAWGEFVVGRVYQNMDNLSGLDFVDPGSWVYFEDGDTLSPGWTIARLWALWWGFVLVSLFVSFLLASMRWRRGIQHFV